MKKTKIILRFLLPAYQYASETIHPTVRPPGYPGTGLEAHLMLDRLGLFTPRANMSNICKLFDQDSDLTRIIRLIQTHALRLLRRRAVVTWLDVPEYREKSGDPTFQVEMYYDGRIQMAWLDISSQDGLVGLSDGKGILPGFEETDLSGRLNLE